MTKTGGGGGGGGEEREVVSWLVTGRAGRQVGRLMANGKQTPCHVSKYTLLKLSDSSTRSRPSSTK